jgi:hypothetical protein
MVVTLITSVGGKMSETYTKNLASESENENENENWGQLTLLAMVATTGFYTATRENMRNK